MPKLRTTRNFYAFSIFSREEVGKKAVDDILMKITKHLFVKKYNPRRLKEGRPTKGWYGVNEEDDINEMPLVGKYELSLATFSHTYRFALFRFIEDIEKEFFSKLPTVAREKILKLIKENPQTYAPLFYDHKYMDVLFLLKIESSHALKHNGFVIFSGKRIDEEILDDIRGALQREGLHINLITFSSDFLFWLFARKGSKIKDLILKDCNFLERIQPLTRSEIHRSRGVISESLEVISSLAEGKEVTSIEILVELRGEDIKIKLQTDGVFYVNMFARDEFKEEPPLIKRIFSISDAVTYILPTLMDAYIREKPQWDREKKEFTKNMMEELRRRLGV